MNVKQLAMSIFLASTFSSAALAENGKYFEKKYVKIEIGLVKPKLNAFAENLKNREKVRNRNEFLGTGIAFGFKHNDHIRTEIGFFESKLVKASGEYKDKIEGENFKRKESFEHLLAKTSARTILLSAYYDFANLHSTITPYVGFGMGLSRVKYDYSFDKEVRGWIRNEYGGGDPDNYPAERKSDKGTKTKFAYKLATGVDLKLSEHVSVDLGYNFIDHGKVKTAFGDQKFRTHNVLVGLKYNF